MIESKAVQRVFGLFMVVLGVAVMKGSWAAALGPTPPVYPKAGVLVPFLIAAGLAMVLFPIDKERLRAEHGVDRVTALAHYPRAWRVLFVVGGLATLVNWLALTRWA